jgi:undecaprenyl-diphosphatase
MKQHVLQFYTGHAATPFLNKLMIFAAEHLVYLIPITLIYLWFAPEKGRTDSAFRMALPAAWFATEKGKSKSVFIVVTIVVSLAISYAMGQFYSHPAPYIVGYETLLTDAPENSFPSQHTTVVFAFALVVCYLQARWRDGLVALALASLVGISRVYVGVHYPIDIVGAVGASLLGFALVYVARDAVMDFASRCIRIENRLRTALLQIR